MAKSIVIRSNFIIAVLLPAVFALSSMILASDKSNGEILKQTKSLHNGELTVLNYGGTRYLLARGRRGIVLQSSMDLTHKSSLTMDYLKVMALMTELNRQPSRIFNLGLGGGELPRFELSRCSQCTVESAEVDPTVVQLATQYFDVSHPRHKIFEGEGFSTLKAQTADYDVIWVDAVLPKQGPRAYINAEDLKTLRGHLKKQGLIIANLGVTKTPELFREAEKGYKRSFSHGIRVKIPVKDLSDVISKLESFISPLRGAPESQLLPNYLIAVGNSRALNCKQFWNVYRSWVKKKLIKLEWNQSEHSQTSEFCQDLH